MLYIEGWSFKQFTVIFLFLPDFNGYHFPQSQNNGWSKVTIFGRLSPVEWQKYRGGQTVQRLQLNSWKDYIKREHACREAYLLKVIYNRWQVKKVVAHTATAAFLLVTTTAITQRDLEQSHLESITSHSFWQCLHTFPSCGYKVFCFFLLWSRNSLWSTGIASTSVCVSVCPFLCPSPRQLQAKDTGQSKATLTQLDHQLLLISLKVASVSGSI